MKKTRFLHLCLVMLVVVSFSISAGGQQEAPEVEDGEISLTVAAGAVGQELELTQEAAAAYEQENPGITVDVLETPDLATDRLGLYLQYFEAKSSEVDIYQIDVIWPGDIAEHLVDLDRYGAEEVKDEHFDAIITNNTVDGTFVAMPWFTDAGLLYYRSDLLEKYGYSEPPATWEELEEIAQTVQSGERDGGNQDFWGFVWQGNAYEGLTCDALEWVVSNGGGNIVEPDGEITIDNPKAAAALDMAAGWVGSISPSGVTGFGEEEARNMFQAGNAMFMRNWPYAYSLGQADSSTIKDKFDVTPLPAGDSGSGAAALGGWQLAVSKYSEHVEEAADLLMYLTGYEEQKRRAIKGSLNPTIKALYDDEDVLSATPFFGTLYDVFTNAAARPSTVTAPRYAEASKIFFSNVHDVLIGNKTGSTAVKSIALDLEDLLE
ncbi:MAG: ABC transporter substrate-binding protein [Spirochaetota bacterium]